MSKNDSPTDGDAQSDNPLLELPPNRQEELITAWEDYASDNDTTNVRRRGFLQAGAALLTGTAIGGGAYALSSEEVAAAANEVGQIGEPGNLVDVYGEDVSAVSVDTEDAQLNQDDWAVRTAARSGSGGSGTKADPYSSGLQSLIDQMDTDIGNFSKRVIINSYFNEAVQLPAGVQNYRLDSAGLQTTRIQAIDTSDAHAFDDNGNKAVNIFDLWIDQRDSSGTYDTLNLTGAEIFLERLDIEANGSNTRHGLMADGVDEFKAHSLHLQGGGVGAGNDSVYIRDSTDVQMDKVDDTTGGDWTFEATGGATLFDIYLSDIDIDGRISFVDNGGSPQRIMGSNLHPQGGFTSESKYAVFSVVAFDSIELTGGEHQHVHGVGSDSAADGVLFDGGISESSYFGSVRNPANATVKFGGASDCVYVGPVAHGVTYSASQTDCDVWPIGEASGTVTSGGTRPRWRGVIGGGPLGGVDLSSTTGQYVGDRAIADGTSAASAGALARWDGASWQYHDATGTV